MSFISELTKLTDQENNPDFPKHEGGGPNICKKCVNLVHIHKNVPFLFYLWIINYSLIYISVEIFKDMNY